MSVHLQGCTGLLQCGGRGFFVEAAALVCVTADGLQENLVDDGSGGVRFEVFQLVTE